MTRRPGRRFVPHGASPAVWRRLIEAIDRRLAYDAATQTVTVRSGLLVGMTKCGPFAGADAAFASGSYEPGGEHNVEEADRLLNSLGLILSEWRGLVGGEPALIQNVVATQN